MASSAAASDETDEQASRRRSSNDDDAASSASASASASAAANAEWKNIQKRAFCRWANEHLRASGLEIGDLATDLGDGVVLIRLAEALSGAAIPQRYNAHPTSRTQRLENVTVCLRFLERQQRVRIVNIGASFDRLIWLRLLFFALLLYYEFP